MINAAKGRHREALAHFDAVVAAEPQYASAHYNRASALQALGRSRDALQSFARVCAIAGLARAQKILVTPAYARFQIDLRLPAERENS